MMNVSWLRDDGFVNMRNVVLRLFRIYATFREVGGFKQNVTVMKSEGQIWHFLRDGGRLIENSIK